MITRTVAFILAALLVGSSLGCTQIGQATGKAVKEVKEMPGEFHKGYKEGRTSEEDSI